MAIIEFPQGKQVGKDSLTVDSTTVEVALSTAEYTPGSRAATAAVLSVVTDAIVFVVDGSDPNTDGLRAAAGDTIILRSEDQIRGFRAVKVTTNATVVAAYFR